MTAAGERAALLALVGLPQVGPARLAALLAHGGGAIGAWEAVRSGTLEGVDLRRRGQGRADLVRDLRAAARAVEPADLFDAHLAAGVEVLVPGDPAWPEVLALDPEPPVVLLATGDTSLLGALAVAVVGTRRCTAGGAQIAGELGAGLADAGVPVVSGLAAGIDGAAHRGVLAAGGRPIGVVGSGLDVVYPPRHRRLWADVAEQGVLVSEALLGRPPERWRFPARNRLIAALSEAVVVVESRQRGGSMSTVEEALLRQRQVLAVPGSVLAEQSAGTNGLLADGADIARGVSDVLAAIGVAVPTGPAAVSSGTATAGSAATGPAAAVAAVLGPAAVGVEQIAAAAGVDVGAALTALARLEAAGAARRVPGGYEQVVHRGRVP